MKQYILTYKSSETVKQWNSVPCLRPEKVRLPWGGRVRGGCHRPEKKGTKEWAARTKPCGARQDKGCAYVPGVAAVLPDGKLIEAYPCQARAVLPTWKDGKAGQVMGRAGMARQGMVDQGRVATQYHPNKPGLEIVVSAPWAKQTNSVLISYLQKGAKSVKQG